jgi:ABC-type multidrug transport system fused ATPase/permease subunit
MRPSMLILDESTSHLDSESEHAIQQAMERMDVPIKVVIAHRLSTILKADQIVVLDEGKIVGCGRHEELQSSCDLYSRLYHLQYASPSTAMN